MLSPLMAREASRVAPRGGIVLISRRSYAVAPALLLVAASALTLAACGSKSKKKSSNGVTPSAVAITIDSAGKSAKYTVPATVKGGLVTLNVTNKAKAPHAAQLVLLKGGHTAKEALKVIGSNSNKTPSWLRGEGGIGGVPPGQSGTATLNLPAGKYLVLDSGGPGSSGPPGYSPFTVTAGKAGTIPTLPTTITAANPAKDKYKWEITGALKPGPNQVTFVSKGKQAIHLIVGFRVTGNPSKAAIIKAVNSNGKPPKFVDQSSFLAGAVLDGGKSQVTPLTLSKPGEYVLFCPLSDRDGGKSHSKEGLLTTVNVK